MPKLPKSAFRWAMRHLILEGDTDLFPRPFEIKALKYYWKEVEPLLGKFAIENYAWSAGRRFVVPKGEISFRSATQLEPLDSLLLTAILKKYGSKLEASRVPASERRVFSYRFDPQNDGRMFGSNNRWHEFWKASLEKASAQNVGYVAIADITDFYNQIYHHVVRRQLDSAGVPGFIGKAIEINFLGATTQGVSRGIPIGPHSVHLLAEVAMDPIDRSLLSKGQDFCRYVDDFHFFCETEEEAKVAILDFVETIDKQQRLSLQREKTKILPVSSFQALAEKMLVDRPLNEQEDSILKVIKKYSDNSPYEWVCLDEIEEEDLEELAEEPVTELIELYLQSEPRNHSRLGWLLRRLAQTGTPSAVNCVVEHLEDLAPVIGDAARYLVRATPHYIGDLKSCGNQILRVIDLPVVKHNSYLRMVLLNLFSRIPALNNIEAITSRESLRESVVRREVILAAARADQQAPWIRERKDDFSQSDPWVRRAIVRGMAVLPGDEAIHWLKKMKFKLTGLEKIVAYWAFDNKKRRAAEKLKLGEVVLP